MTASFFINKQQAQIPFYEITCHGNVPVSSEELSMQRTVLLAKPSPREHVHSAQWQEHKGDVILTL